MGQARRQLKRAGVTYENLPDHLARYGFRETRASIADKLALATISAHFFLASLAAIKVNGIDLRSFRRHR
jgi:Domain of unknown function (DUF6471)